jgi:hypothetical protein
VLSGIAVRYRTLVHAERPCEVVANLRVPDRDGHDARAAAELSAKARAIHADFITNVGFDPDPTNPSRTVLRGTAVRYR